MRNSSLRIGFMVISLCLPACLAFRGSSKPQTKSPDLVLEARIVTRGIGGIQTNLLLVRLTNDGKAEWEDYVSRTKTRRDSATIPFKEVVAIQQRLDEIDKSVIKPQMGPYGTYIDTNTQLSVRLHSESGVLKFTIYNPWPNDSIHSQPMPKEVKSIICEIWALQAKLAKVPVDSMCDSSQDQAQKKK
jgi:hypothetical protein